MAAPPPNAGAPDAPKDEDPWKFCTRAFINTLLPATGDRKCAAILAAPKEGNGDPGIYFRDFATMEELKVHTETTLRLASTPDSHVKNSIQITFVPSPMGLQLFNHLSELINPLRDGREASLIQPGICALTKNRWRTDLLVGEEGERDASWTGLTNGWTALNSTFYIQDPGLLQGAITAFFPANNTTVVVYYNLPVVWGPAEFLHTVRETFHPLYLPGIFSHPLTACLMTLHWLLTYYNRNPNSISPIQKALLDTGFHRFVDHKRADARGLTPNQLADHTADMMASSSTLYNEAAGVRGVIACLDLLREENRLIDEWAEHRNAKGKVVAHRDIDEWARQLKPRAEAVLAYREGWGMRANAVVQGLQNVIGQKNQEETRRIAEESRRLAEQSKRLAEASWKDTASVTAVTLITMLFLPATFMATLFSADFVKDAFKNNANHQATTYAAVTVPLTAVVVLVWYAWTSFRRRRAKKMLQRRQTLEAQREKEETPSSN